MENGRNGCDYQYNNYRVKTSLKLAKICKRTQRNKNKELYLINLKNITQTSKLYGLQDFANDLMENFDLFIPKNKDVKRQLNSKIVYSNEVIDSVVQKHTKGHFLAIAIELLVAIKDVVFFFVVFFDNLYIAFNHAPSIILSCSANFGIVHIIKWDLLHCPQ